MITLRLIYNYIRMQKHQINIQITPQQQKLFDTLMQYRKQLGLQTTMRVAGGWVRDKIMGLQSHDIDITLDDMKGQQFVKKLKQLAQSKNQKISSFGVTKFNPELSKHLQTATAKINNQQIDFVNLRSQVYNQNSRIPQIEMGTPLTDALRRDFTINTLFYNINAKQIQDYTQKGIEDIYHKIIRTPLKPLMTFKDDPLRVLRCFRFKARFSFKIDQDIYNSLNDKGVHQALKTKVSKQRIGIQLAGILKAKYPLQALEQIFKFDFWHIVFEIPSNSDLKDQNYIAQLPKYGFQMIKYGLESIKNYGLRYSITNQAKELQIAIPLSFILYPYVGYKALDGKKTIPLIEHISKNELKYSNKVSQFTSKVAELVQDLQKILITSNQLNFRVKLIKWLRDAKQKWQICLHVLSVQLMLSPQNKLNIQPMKLRDQIFQLGLQNCYLTTSYIDGGFLTKKGYKGPILKTILDNTIIWRILNKNQNKQSFISQFQKNKQFFQSQKSYQ